MVQSLGTPIETIKFLIKIEVLIKSIKSLNGECWPESEINPYVLQEGPLPLGQAVCDIAPHICLYPGLYLVLADSGYG